MRERAPDNRLVGVDSSVPHGAPAIRAHARKAVVDPDYPGVILAVDGDYAARARARVVDTTDGVKAEPAWTHAARDGVNGVKENLAVVDANGPHWATEGEADDIANDWKKKGALSRRRMEATSIDARAFFDGRMPDGWQVGDVVPDCALAANAESHYVADFCSHQLCNCATRYFLCGTSLFVEITERLEKAS